MSQPHLKKQIILRKNEDRRIIGGHPWAFSNEIRETKGDPVIGDVVELIAASGVSLGVGFYNPHSLIAFRLLSKTIEEIDAGFFQRRIQEAATLRERLYPGADACRMVHGEGDFLPGLVVDRFGQFLSVQAFAYGMDIRLPVICDVLESLVHPVGIVERNESPLRTLENLPQKKGVLRGVVAPTVIEEHGIHYRVDLLEGQKTGFFLDQRENRASIGRYSNGASVLDCFCNDGGFALNAARSGAACVLGIDSSADAVGRARANALLNRLERVEFEEKDVFEKLQELQSGNERFDVIVLDPPSFTKSRKNVQAAKKGYREIHEGAIRLLHKGGTLLTASCSHHIEPEVFLSVVEDAAQRTGRNVQLLDWRGAAPDHPTLPAVPETRYLKFGIFRVL